MKYKQTLYVGIASAICLAATIVIAAPKWQSGMTGIMGGPGMMSGSCMMRGRHGMMKGPGSQGQGMGIGMMQTQLDELESQLKLSKEQQQKWDEFKQVVKRQAESMLAHRQEMQGLMQSGQTLTLPERLAFHSDMMGKRFASMTSYSAALTDVYQSLNPQQQKILDQNSFMGCY